jgi:putative spermidine/putrescine transport system substrate-binding protein
MAVIMLASCTSEHRPASEPAGSWENILKQSRGTTVYWMMWQGDPMINRYVQEYVVPEVKKRFDINLKPAPGQGNEVVKVLMAEQEAGVNHSAVDLCWINGETFFQLRQIAGLYGPFTDKLPGIQYVDLENPFIGTDFQQKTDGYECPWGNVQLAVIYDSLRTPAPPRDLVALEQWLREHPGKFTIPYDFTGMTLLKSWMIAFGGSSEILDGPFREDLYMKLSGELWGYINRNKSFFWQKGTTFPENLAAMHRMFANGELDFTFSNNHNEVDNKIGQGVFPGSARSYVFDSGTIRNSHYLGIPAKSANKAGAMVVADFLISPEAQLKKQDPGVWGDGTVLSVSRLPAGLREQFTQARRGSHAPDPDSLMKRALKEPAPEYMIRLYRDFRTFIIEK